MLPSLALPNILFLDIETVPQYPEYHQVPIAMRQLWDKKVGTLLKEEETPASLYRRAGIYAEFGKVVCISCGYFTEFGNFQVMSFCGEDEWEILIGFNGFLRKFCSAPGKILCAHNGKEFDFPFLSRRMVINGIPLPNILDTPGKKPWEVNHLDTMELWKFGDYKSYTSLALLAAVLGIPTPKDDIDGSRVWEVYWHDHDIERIATYCRKDVITVAQIIRRFRGEALLSETEIDAVFVESVG